MCYFMWNVLFMYVLCAYLGQWHIWLCILLMYNTNVYAVFVSIYFYAIFWSYDSQCAERHLPHVHWLWRTINQIIDVLAFNPSLIHVCGFNAWHYFIFLFYCVVMHVSLFFNFYCVVIYILKCMSVKKALFSCVVIHILKCMSV
jgi:hypothetical protein